MADKRRTKRDYYVVLGVPKDADEVELKRAFRELARKYHPDINPSQSAEDRFKEANEAYAILSNAKTRARYDRYGFAGVGGGADAGGPGGISNVAQTIDDLFGDIIKRRRAKRRGRDLRYTLEVTFEEAALGCKKSIEVAPPGTDGTLTGGKPKTFEVVVPPGTKNGAVRMIRAEGEPGKDGAPPGDLHVIVRVAGHPIFRREGFDIWCEVPVSFAQAALGAVVEVPTLHGIVKMRIPPGVQSGRVFRMGQKGIAKSASGGARGDQRVRVIVETPTNLGPRQRELLEEFAKTSGDALVHPRKQTFLDRLRGLIQN